MERFQNLLKYQNQNESIPPEDLKTSYIKRKFKVLAILSLFVMIMVAIIFINFGGNYLTDITSNLNDLKPKSGKFSMAKFKTEEEFKNYLENSVSYNWVSSPFSGRGLDITVAPELKEQAISEFPERYP